MNTVLLFIATIGMTILASMTPADQGWKSWKHWSRLLGIFAMSAIVFMSGQMSSKDTAGRLEQILASQSQQIDELKRTEDKLQITVGLMGYQLDVQKLTNDAITSSMLLVELNAKTEAQLAEGENDMNAVSKELDIVMERLTTKTERMIRTAISSSPSEISAGDHFLLENARYLIGQLQGIDDLAKKFGVPAFEAVRKGLDQLISETETHPSKNAFELSERIAACGESIYAMRIATAKLQAAERRSYLKLRTEGHSKAVDAFQASLSHPTPNAVQLVQPGQK